MSLVNARSPVTPLSEMELFSTAPVQTTIEATRIDEVRPISQLNTGGYIEFDIPSNFNEYIKLDEIALFVKFRVRLLKTDKSSVTDDNWNHVSMINNIAHSLWNQVDLSINDVQTTISLLTYAHKAYFNTIIYSTEHARKSYLRAAGYFEDDIATLKHALNNNRTTLIKHVTPSSVMNDTDTHIGEPVELLMKPYLDLLRQNKSLLGGCKLRLKFVPNRPEFLFMVNDTTIIPQIEFLDVYLEVPKAIVSDQILIAHNRALQESPAKYPIERVEVRSMTINAGVTGKPLENVINGVLPRRIYLYFLTNEAFNGSYEKNPFYFGHFNVSEVACFVNGRRIAYTPNFNKKLYMKEYTSLCRGANQLNDQNQMTVNYENFKNGNTIFVFNLSPDLSDSFQREGHVSPPREGIVRFEIQFSQATDEVLNAMFYCEFDNMLSITEDRQSQTDY